MGSCHANCSAWHDYIYGEYSDPASYPNYKADPDIAGIGVSDVLERFPDAPP